MSYLLLLVMLLGSAHGRRDMVTTCDLIELNHHYDAETGKHAYDQYIFYNWSPDYRRYDVIAWTLEQDSDTMTKANGIYSVRWRDRDNRGIVRVLKAKLYRETWGCVDPERANKRLFDERFRVGLPRR